MISPYLTTPLRTETEYMADVLADQEDVMSHTPTPWVYHSGSVWQDGPGVFPNGEALGTPIAKMDRDTDLTAPTERDANAAFIVKACNSHAQLVDALRSIAAIEDAKGDDRSPLRYARHIAKVALAAATE